MPTINYKDSGALSEYEYLTGTITDIKSEDDTVSVSCDCGTFTEVPVFYHCSDEVEKRENGALVGGSSAFGVGDVVVLLKVIETSTQASNITDSKINLHKKKDTITKPVRGIFVVGHYDGIKPCGKDYIEIYTHNVGWSYWDPRGRKFIDIIGNNGEAKKIWETQEEYSDWITKRVKRKFAGASQEQRTVTKDGKTVYELKIVSYTRTTFENPFLRVEADWFITPDNTAYNQERGAINVDIADIFATSLPLPGGYTTSPPYMRQYWIRVTGKPHSFYTYLGSTGITWAAWVPVEKLLPVPPSATLWVGPAVPLFTNSIRTNFTQSAISETDRDVTVLELPYGCAGYSGRPPTYADAWIKC